MTGTEIIRHLAEKVMGWKVFDVSSIGFPGFPVLVQKGEFWMLYGSEQEMGGRFFDPLESIADAFEVLAKFCQPDRAHFVMGAAPCGQVTVWLVDWTWAIAKRQNVVPEMHDPAILGSYTGDTIPLAICLAMVEATR